MASNLRFSSTNLHLRRIDFPPLYLHIIVFLFSHIKNNNYLMDVTNDYGFHANEAKELYKLHTGICPSSGSDTDSAADNQDLANNEIHKHIVLDQIKPPLIDYDVIMGKGIPIAPATSATSESSATDNDSINPGIGPQLKYNLTIEEIIEEKLQSKTAEDNCYICSVKFHPNNRLSHYDSKRHRKKVVTWKNKEKIILGAPGSLLKDVNQISQRSITTSANIFQSSNSELPFSFSMNPFTACPFLNPMIEATIELRLQSLIFYNYCCICLRSIYGPLDSLLHYSSSSHGINVRIWKDFERAKLMPYNPMPVRRKKKKPAKNKVKSKFNFSINISGLESEYSDYDSNQMNSHSKTDENETKKDEIKTTKNEKLSDCRTDAKVGFEKYPTINVIKREQCLSDNCLLCKTELNTPEIASGHYQSNMHKNKFKVELEERINSATLPTDDSLDEIDEFMKKIVEERLKRKLSSLYCYICSIDLEISCFPSQQCVDVHKESDTHKSNVELWKNKERKKFIIPEGRLLEEQLYSHTYSTHCYLCMVDLNGTSIEIDHYNSDRHVNAVRIWRNREMEKIIELGLSDEPDDLYNIISFPDCPICRTILSPDLTADEHDESIDYKMRFNKWVDKELQKRVTSGSGENNKASTSNFNLNNEIVKNSTESEGITKGQTDEPVLQNEKIKSDFKMWDGDANKVEPKKLSDQVFNQLLKEKCLPDTSTCLLSGMKLATSEISNLHNELLNHQQKVPEGKTSLLASKLYNSKLEIDDCKSERDDSQSEIDDAKSEIDSKSEIDDCKSEPDDSKSEIDDAKSEINDFKSEIDDCKSAIDDSKSEPDDFKSESDDLKSEIDDSKSEIDDCKSEPDDSKSEIDDAKSEIDDSKSEIDDCKSEPDDSKSEIDDAKSEIDSKSEIDDCKSEPDDSKSEIDDAKSEIDSKSEINDFKSEIDDCKSAIDDSKSEPDDFKSEIDDLKSEINDSKSEPDDSKSETDDSKSETCDSKSKSESSEWDVPTLEVLI